MLSLCVALSGLVLPQLPHPQGLRSAPLTMASGNDGVDFPELDGAEMRIGIIKARWHPQICDSLAEGAKAALAECGVKPENIFESEVPGSFELPLAARYLAMSGTVDAILPIGLLIKGDTLHMEVISEAVTGGLMNVGMSTGIPVVFGVLTTMDEQQAKDRAFGDNNHGLQWGKAAVEMALLRTTALGGGSASKKLFLGFGGPEDEQEVGAKKNGLSVGEKKVGF